MEIKIDKLRDTIIIEKYDGDTILKGSNLFCGCCGKPMGVLKKNLTFPFNTDVLRKNLKEISFEVSRFGLRHKCGHTMFTFRQVGFSKMDEYLERTKSEVIT